MTDTNEQLIEALDAHTERRNDRREFFKAALGAAAVAGAGASAITLGGIATAQGLTDTDWFNFALNLEYLEAQFYSYAAFGTGLANADLAPGSASTTTQGAVTGGAQVSFADPLVAQYAKEIAQDKIAHVRFLRTTLSGAQVAQPAIDIGVTPTSAFSKLAQAASVVGAGTGFNVYANDENFLLGAFMLADVGVTAYKGLTPLLTNANDLAAVAGILATKAYHASTIRTVLYAKGATTASLRTNADAISNARDVLDGAGATREFDQGISPTGTGTTLQSNITPLDGNGLAFSRTTGQVLNIVYLTSASVTAGGFYPAGLNGTIRTSTAST
ncbi:ferritin-like domain-containing protein [Sphingomonas sp. So64.6b]|uniref:ferritin-like domain-containing protein n=1 Tax=Sphingomonas sp. So64.6b TaxID=2997354 RepID=UPI0016040606|nr:ferritin-like domain-containing protein [Sphingomonas sp. So64.6b]QNA85931.1 ferritin-like domain-containing protein [Sphingomonas sp. So64.6b]